jgi:lipopolysaccharide export system permease protein
MPTILTLCLFISIIATLSRMYRDSEMVIWFSSGRGMGSLLRPLFRFAWPVLLFVVALALIVLPWSNRQVNELRDIYEKRGDIERIEPGRFQESASGNRVFFVEKNNAGKQSGTNVFVATTENGKETVTSARSGRVQDVGQDRFLTLNNGQRLENSIGKNDLKISEFEVYGVKVAQDLRGGSDLSPLKTRPTKDLVQDPTAPNLAELSWRTGLIFAAINLIILSVPVSSVNPRVGTGTNLGFAIFTFIIYYNILSLGQSWIASGAVSFAVFSIALHGGAFIFATLWLIKGHNNWRWDVRRNPPVDGPRKVSA